MYHFHQDHNAPCGEGVDKVHYGFGDSPYCCSNETQNKFLKMFNYCSQAIQSQ